MSFQEILKANNLSNANIGIISTKDFLSRKILPNTRLIIEPNIIGTKIFLDYSNGSLNKIFKRMIEIDLSFFKNKCNLPIKLPVNINLSVVGILYKNKIQSIDVIEEKDIQKPSYSFCAFHIFNTKLNHFSSLRSLKSLGFEVPDCFYTKNNVNEVDIYIELINKKKIFNRYPNNGIILKINSRKFQSQISKNSMNLNYWTFKVLI